MGKYNITDEYRRTELHYAAKNDNHDKMQEILEYGENIGGFIKDSDGTVSFLNTWHTALYFAGCITYPITLGYVSLSDFVYLDYKDDFGNTPLHYAAQHGNIDSIELFEKYDANLEAVNKEEFTPLNVAIKCKNYENAVKLLQLGAKDSIHSSLQKNPFVQELSAHLNSYKNGTRTVDDWKAEKEAERQKLDAKKSSFLNTKSEEKEEKSNDEELIPAPEKKESVFVEEEELNAEELCQSAEEAFEESQKFEGWFS